MHAEGSAPDAHLVLSMDNDVATTAWNPHDDVDFQSCNNKTHDIEFYISPVCQEGRKKKTLEIVECFETVAGVAEVKPRIGRALSHQDTKSWSDVWHCTLLSQVGN